MQARFWMALAMAAQLAVAPVFAQDRVSRLVDSPTASHALWKHAPLEIAPSAAAYFSNTEVEAIQSTVREQLRAILARDADQAFIHLAPSSKDYYADARAFLRRVETDLPALLDAETLSFAMLDRDSIDAVQDVTIVRNDGRQWMARFTLERQSDGGWGIKRCLVEPGSIPRA